MRNIQGNNSSCLKIHGHRCWREKQQFSLPHGQEFLQRRIIFDSNKQCLGPRIIPPVDTIPRVPGKGTINPKALDKECKCFKAEAACINCAELYKSHRKYIPATRAA